jgi:hypothetical protein
MASKIFQSQFKDVPLPNMHLRYGGIWDMQDLYESMINYLRNKKYKFNETAYKHKHPSPFGVERQYVWRATREETEWLKFIINVYIHTYDAHDVEVIMKDGTKHIFTKGRMWMEFTGTTEIDYEHRFDENSFYAHIKDWYNKYILKKVYTEVIWDRLWYREVHKLRWLVKQKLKMEADSYVNRYWMGVHT